MHYGSNSRRRWLLCVTTLPFIAAAVAARADSGKVPMADRIVLPPDRREFSSPSGKYVLTLTSADHWKSRLAQAQLQSVSAEEIKSLWHKTLPQERGPRRALVLDTGAVVLMDEWINVASRYAVMLLSPNGDTLVVHGFDDLVRVLGVSRRTVADHGRMGLWMSSTPTLSEDGNAVIFQSAGRKLLLRLEDGLLSASD